MPEVKSIAAEALEKVAEPVTTYEDPERERRRRRLRVAGAAGAAALGLGGTYALGRRHGGDSMVQHLVSREGRPTLAAVVDAATEGRGAVFRPKTDWGKVVKDVGTAVKNRPKKMKMIVGTRQRLRDLFRRSRD